MPTTATTIIKTTISTSTTTTTTTTSTTTIITKKFYNYRFYYYVVCCAQSASTQSTFESRHKTKLFTSGQISTITALVSHNNNVTVALHQIVFELDLYRI